MKREELLPQLEELGMEDMLFMDGFDGAIIGICQRFSDWCILYDYDEVISILMEDMSHQMAIEYFDFNIGGGWIGEHTPVFLHRGEGL